MTINYWSLRVTEFVVRSNILLITAVVLLSLATGVLAGGQPHTGLYLLLLAAACSFEYFLHHYLKFILSGNRNAPEKFSWLLHNLKAVRVIILLSGAVTVITFLLVSRTVMLIVLLTGFFTLLYSLPARGEGSVFSLRRIPLLKTFATALIWTVITVFVPFADAGFVETTGLSLIFFTRFLLLFSVALMFDLRDVAEDRSAGILTIPGLAGRRLTLVLVSVLLLGFMGASCLLPVAMPDRLLPALAAAAPLFMLIFIPRLWADDLILALVLDGSLVVYGLGVLLG